MPDLSTFFRHCPSCGRRFEIRLVTKEEVGSETIKEGVRDEMGSAALGEEETAIGAVDVTPGSIRTVLREERPNLVDIERFQYTYECKHCGHEWKEIREKEHSLGELKGYTRD